MTSGFSAFMWINSTWTHTAADSLLRRSSGTGKDESGIMESSGEEYNGVEEQEPLPKLMVIPPAVLVFLLLPHQPVPPFQVGLMVNNHMVQSSVSNELFTWISKNMGYSTDASVEMSTASKANGHCAKHPISRMILVLIMVLQRGSRGFARPGSARGWR